MSRAVGSLTFPSAHSRLRPFRDRVTPEPFRTEDVHTLRLVSWLCTRAQKSLGQPVGLDPDHVERPGPPISRYTAPHDPTFGLLVSQRTIVHLGLMTQSKLWWSILPHHPCLELYANVPSPHPHITVRIHARVIVSLRLLRSYKQ